MALEQAIFGPRFEVDDRARAGRKARLETLVDAHYGLIWRLLRRLGLPAHAADDAAQQVFLITTERLDDIRPGSERAFAFGTALRVAKSARRKFAREVPGGEDQDGCPLPDPEALSDQKRARDLLDEILQALPLPLRTVFILFELEGLTSPQIAALTELPLGTVASRLRRAREAFHRRVRQVQARAHVRGGTP